MENRKMILDKLQSIHNHCEQLKDVVETATDQELENILDNHFSEFAGNIQVNLDFMEMVITRMDPDLDEDCPDRSKMSNEELAKYFEENWMLLAYI